MTPGGSKAQKKYSWNFTFDLTESFLTLIDLELFLDVLCGRAVNDPKYPSVLQALDIEDPVVANCLIDQRGIESILLIKVNKKFKLLLV